MYCDICPKARQHRLPFSVSISTSSHAFELVHVDTWGPYHARTHAGHRYFLTVVVDYTRATWTHLMVTKDEAIGLLKAFVKMAQTQFSATVKVCRTDNALEFSSSTQPWNSLLTLAYYIKLVVFKLHNKMGLWRGSINTCLRFLELYYSSHLYH